MIAMALKTLVALVLSLSLGARVALGNVEIRRCSVTRSDADKALALLRQDKTKAFDSVLLGCVADSFDSRERPEDAEWIHLEAIRRSGLDQAQSAEALGSLGRYYARHGRVEKVEEVWNRLAMVQNVGARTQGLLLMAPAVVDLAEQLYRWRDLEASLRMVRLVEANEAASGNRTLVHEPWLTFLLARSGRVDEAERVFDERIRSAREVAARDHAPGFLVQELEAFADFLTSVGRVADAREADEEASQLRLLEGDTSRNPGAR
jgi:hypothetical protein